MTPEFSRPLRLDTIGTTPREFDIEADETERAALSRRFGLVAIRVLSSAVTVRSVGADVDARGRVRASVVQRCVVTGEEVAGEIDEPFTILFREHPAGGGGDEETELDAGELDVTFIEGGAIDLGEAAAETLALALDPYPRAPGAEEALRAAGVKTEEEAGPFAALAALRDKSKQ